VSTWRCSGAKRGFFRIRTRCTLDIWNLRVGAYNKLDGLASTINIVRELAKEDSCLCVAIIKVAFESNDHFVSDGGSSWENIVCNPHRNVRNFPIFGLGQIFYRDISKLGCTDKEKILCLHIHSSRPGSFSCVVEHRLMVPTSSNDGCMWGDTWK